MTTGEMSRWFADGKLVRRGHGVYKVARWVPTPLDPFAEAVALMGDGSFLWGESVLSMHGLALVDPHFGVRGDAEARAAQAARLGKSRARAQRRVDDVLRGHTLPARRRRHQGVRGVRHGRAPCRSGETRARRGARHLRRIREPDEGAAMKEAKRPNNGRNLDIAIDRLCASTGDEPGRVKRLLRLHRTVRRQRHGLLRWWTRTTRSPITYSNASALKCSNTRASHPKSLNSTSLRLKRQSSRRRASTNSKSATPEGA